LGYGPGSLLFRKIKHESVNNRNDDRWRDHALRPSDSSEWFISGSDRSIAAAQSASRFDAFRVSLYPIMIVDDNEGVCILIARMLSNIGFKSIYIANSAKQAYDIFGTQMAEIAKDPIIFLDLRLPDVPGEKVAKKIIEIRPSSRIIVVTAEDSSAESAQEAMRQGACAYIQKPIGLSKIRNVLASVLEEMESSQERSSGGGGSVDDGNRANQNDENGAEVEEERSRAAVTTTAAASSTRAAASSAQSGNGDERSGGFQY
jgi:DNA-binding NtrC family response regulator